MLSGGTDNFGPPGDARTGPPVLPVQLGTRAVYCPLLTCSPPWRQGISFRTASCGTSVASRFTGSCHPERWSYIASTGVLSLPASQGGDVLRGVDIPVVDRAAGSAGPYP